MSTAVQWYDTVTPSAGPNGFLRGIGRIAGRWDDHQWDRGARMAILAGAALRLVWVMVLHPPYLYLFSDMRGYLDLAGRVASGGVAQRIDALYPPGTHLILAVPLILTSSPVTGILADALLWWALASAIPLFAWLFFRRLLGPRPAALAAALCALWPLLIAYAGYFTSETPALALLLASLWLSGRVFATNGRAAVLAAAGAGLAGAAAVGTRPQFLLNLAIAGIPLIWSWRQRLWATLAFMAAGAAVLGGVVAYNSAAAGQLTGLSENGGILFFQAQCDAHSVIAGQLQFANPVAAELHHGYDYVFSTHDAWDQAFFFKEGMACIRRNGWTHLRLVARNLLDTTATTTPWPLDSTSRLKAVSRTANLMYCLALPFMLLGAMLTLRAKSERTKAARHGVRQLLLHLGAVLPVVIVFSSEPRYRIPYDVFGFALLAALAVPPEPSGRSTAQ